MRSSVWSGTSDTCGRSSSFDAYLRRTVVNLSKNHFRRRAVERRFLARAAEPEPVPGPEGASIDRHTIVHALGRLQQRQRAAIVLRYYEEFFPEDAVPDICPPVPSGNRPITRSARCPDAPIRPQGGHRCLATPTTTSGRCSSKPRRTFPARAGPRQDGPQGASAVDRNGVGRRGARRTPRRSIGGCGRSVRSHGAREDAATGERGVDRQHHDGHMDPDGRVAAACVLVQRVRG